MSAYRKTATSTGRKQYSEMKGTARAFDELGSAVFDNNAYAGTSAGTKSTDGQITKAGGNTAYIQAAVTSAVATQGALMSAIGQPGGAQAYIDNAQYEAALKSRSQTKNRKEDIKNKLASDEETDPVTGKTRKTDTKITSDLGEARLQNEAIEAGTERQKVANRKATEADKINAMFNQDSKIDKAATLKNIGITENDLAAGANMSDDALKKIKLHQEKKMEKSEFIAKDVEGHNNAVTMRTGYTEGDDKKLRANSEIENSSSFRKMEMGEKTDFHAKDTVESAAKQTAVGTMGSSAITAGEAFVIGAFGAGALAFGGKAIDSFKNHFAGSGAKARTTGGGFAVKAEDGNWFETDKDGNGLLKDGKPISANKRLQPSSVTAAKGMWNTAVDSAYDLKDRISGAFGDESVSKTNHSNSGENPNKPNSSVNNSSQHGNSSFDMNNDTTSEKSAQGERSKINSMGAKPLGKVAETLEHSSNNGAKALGLTVAAYTAVESLFGSDAQAAPTGGIKVAAKPVASSGFLDNLTGNMGLASMGTSVATFAEKMSAPAMKFLGGTAAKVAPGVGIAYGTLDTANRTSKGDYLGAAMSAGVAVSSALPVGGTAVALGITAAQMATDYMGVTGGNPNAIAQAQHHTAQQQFQASTATTGSFPALQQAMANNPINVNMQSSPQQMASSISVADAVAATRTGGGVQMTASDVQQSYQMTHATNTSASYIKEVSRSMINFKLKIMAALAA